MDITFIISDSLENQFDNKVPKIIKFLDVENKQEVNVLTVIMQ